MAKRSVDRGEDNAEGVGDNSAAPKTKTPKTTTPKTTTKKPAKKCDKGQYTIF